ncbi:MAG TPA: response regulator [Burkholderiaceae bacterium]
MAAPQRRRPSRARRSIGIDPVVAQCGAEGRADVVDGPPCGMSNLLAFVVEDSPVIQENLIAALEEMAPVKVVGTAVDQAGALTWLSDDGNRCDIAIIDIFLRQGSGMGVLRALHASGAPFERVVLTNYATADIRRQCLALGASAVFDKSGEIDALVDHCVARAARTA